MQELLSNPEDETLPVSQQVFYELRIDDSDDGFIVKQTRIRWSESDKQFVWEEPETELWPTLVSARNRYDARLQTLRAKGFIQSDMELF